MTTVRASGNHPDRHCLRRPNSNEPTIVKDDQKCVRQPSGSGCCLNPNKSTGSTKRMFSQSGWKFHYLTSPSRLNQSISSTGIDF